MHTIAPDPGRHAKSDQRAAADQSPHDAALTMVERTDAALEGVIQRLVIQEGRQTVLNAVLNIGSEHAVALYMRGQELRGIVEVGDRVSVTSASRRTANGTVHATHLRNLTTNAPFALWNPPLRDRLTSLVGPVLLSAVIGPVVGAVITVILTSLLTSSAGAPADLTSSTPEGGGGASTVETRPSHLATIMIVAGVIALLVSLATFRTVYLKPRRARRAMLLATTNAGHPARA